MQCSVCGTELERQGQGHTCRSALPVTVRPPTGWVVGTWVVMAFAALFVVFALLTAKVALDLPSSGELPPSRLALTMTVTLAWFVILIGTVISQLMWNRRTRRLANTYGFDGALIIRHWFLRVYAVTVIVTVFLQPLLNLGKSGGIALVAAIRVVAGLVLMANVLIGRSRLLRLIADSSRQSQQARDQTAAGSSTPTPTDRDLDELWSRITP
jgi:hypothetical protein